MMKSSRFIFCAAAASTTTTATTTTETAAKPAAAPEKPAKATYTTTAWKEVKIQPWMQRQFNNNNSENDSKSIMFHGEKCGPQPVLLLPSLSSFNKKLVTPAGTKDNASSSYSTFFSALNHQHGVLSLPYNGIDLAKISSAADKRKELARNLRGDCSSRPDIVSSTQREIDEQLDDGFMTAYCHDLVRKLDQLNVEWVTCVGESFGALVAAKLSLLFPERVGSVFLLNTPLVNRHSVEFAKNLNQARKAILDINVPEGLLDFTISEELVESKHTSTFPAMMAEEDDQAVVKALLGTNNQEDNNNNSILADGDINSWMTHDQLCLLRHPMCIAIPADKAALEIETSCASAMPEHEQCFNIRRVAKVKSATPDTKSLMSSSTSSSTSSKKGNNNSNAVIEETADQLSQWIKRYDADELVKRRWQQAKTDMSRMMGGSNSSSGKEQEGAAAAAAAGGGEGKGGKKGGGKKKEKKQK